MKRPLISIVMAYCNRKRQLAYTLLSIQKSKFKDIEIIIVDDCSNEENRIGEFTQIMPFKLMPITIIRLNPKDRWYINPCIPFNIGIKQAKGKIIVLQNPECLHVHDNLSYIAENVNDSNYISLGAYALDKIKTEQMQIAFDDNRLPEFFKELPNVAYEPTSWYNHSIYRPGYYHFCSAMTLKNMNKLNGFDERYASGIGYDDNEIIARIRRMGLNVIIEDNHCVIHQFHEAIYDNMPEYLPLMNINKELFSRVTMKEDTFAANPKKNIDEINNQLQNNFTAIYNNNIWGSKETRSGYGSELKQTSFIIKKMPDILKKYNIHNLIEIGCGDFNWMQKVSPYLDNYIGIDIVQEMIDKNREKYGSDNIRFECEVYPYWIMYFSDKMFNAVLFADMLVHLPYFMSLSYLNAVKKAGVKYLFATTFKYFRFNEDIRISQTGWRPLNMELEPFKLGKPIELIRYKESYVENNTEIKNDKYLGLWKIN